MAHRDRHPKQPWLYPLTDLRPQGPVEAEVFTMDDLILWLYVREVPDPWWLAIRQTASGTWLAHIPTSTPD